MSIQRVTVTQTPSPSGSDYCSALSNCLWHYYNTACKIPDAIVNTIRVARTVINNRADLLGAFSCSLWRNDSIYPFTTGEGTTHHVVVDPKVATAVTSYFRHDPQGMMCDFENAKAFETCLRGLVADPSTSRQELLESFIFTATANAAQQYHMAIVTHLQGLSIEDQTALLQPLIENSVSAWAREPYLDARRAARAFAMQSILLLFFNLPEVETDKMSQALDYIINTMTNAIVKRPPSEQEQRDYQSNIASLRQSIEFILEQSTSEESILHAVQAYTPIQKKSLIFILLFAGVDTTATLINYLLWQLGRGSAVSDEGISRFIEEGLRAHTPAPIIGRYPREPITIHITDSEGKTTHYPVCPPEGLLIVPELTPKTAPFASIPLFGGGPHLCPGRRLALLEVELLIKHLLAHYTIHTNGPLELTSSSLVVRKASPAIVTLAKKNI